MARTNSSVLTPNMAGMATNLDSASVQQAMRKRRTRLFLGWLIVIAGILGNVAVFSWWVQQYADPVAQQSSTGNTPGRAAAWVAIDSWLDQDPQPLPGGQVLSWDGVDVTTVPAVQNRASYSIELHTFTIASGQAIFESGVEVYVDADGARAVATPSLIPVAGTPAIPSGTAVWPGYETVGDGNGRLEVAAQAWSDAFTSGNADDLGFVVNDPDVDAYYVPLTGISDVTATITDAGAPEGDSNPTEVIARVELQIAWDGGDDAESSDEPQTQTITYDVLFAGANTGTPRVVAWGAVGTGPTLEAFQNAHSLVSSDAPVVTVPPTATPSNEPESTEPASTEPAAEDQSPPEGQPGNEGEGTNP